MKTAFRHRLWPIYVVTVLMAFTTRDNAEVSYAVDVKKSNVRWTGYYLFEFGEHNGTLNLVSGNVLTQNEMITGGHLDVDMKSIKNLDMPKDDGGESLQEHLTSEDFFDAGRFPLAQLKILKAQKINDGLAGKANFDITSELTIKGITNVIKFPAQITITESTIEAKARFKFDRTKWNIKYKSGKFLADAGDGAISDAIAVEVELFASKNN